MLSEWMNKNKQIFVIDKSRILVLILFSLLFLGTRVPRLWNDTINPDAVNWHYRTQQFVNGLKYGQFEKTYQHYHPGVTMMWITGISTELFKQVSGIKTHDIYSFQAFDFVSKLSLVLVQLALSLYIIFIFRKYFGVSGAVLLVSLFTFEPFFVGNSRLYHLDILVTLLVFSALITGYLAKERNSILYYVATGILFSLAFLTKSIAILGIGVYGLWYLFQVFKAKEYAQIKNLVLVSLVFVATTFVTFPALWVKPIYYITQVFTESERVGLRRGHSQIVFGEPTNEASFWFYPVIFVLKTSPLLLIGLLVFGLYAYKLNSKYLKQIGSGFTGYLGLFILIYVIFMSLASKKIDRYILVLYPFLAVYSYYGYLALIKIKNTTSFIVLSVLAFIAYPLVSQFPYYFTYTNPLFGSAIKANQVVGQKSFGIGVYDLKDTIVSNYGEVKLGFIDTKPMESIYPNSKVFDIRITGASDYDLMVLGINEDFPVDIELENNVKFTKDRSIYINGLEYWRIFKKSTI